jgi:membrane-associated protease RseP (regulator of RpoE activity)
MLMALARMMQGYKPKLQRSIVFVAFGAEEMGLLGSSEFISQPLFDLKKITAMINFDMVGRLNPENPVLSVGGVGTAAEFAALLDRHAQNRSFTAGYSAEGYGPSDHAVFYAQDIPVLYFSTGVHGDYHTPDDRPEKINMHGAEEVARFVADIIAELAGGSVRLTFTEAGPKERNPHGYGLQVKLGIMPDFTDTSAKGLRIGGVTKGAPAYNGGLLRGDIITALDGKTVENIYDYMERLKAFSPGQTISVDILRGTEAKVFLIQL